MRKTMFILIFIQFGVFFEFTMLEFLSKNAWAMSIANMEDNIITAAKEVKKKNRDASIDITYLIDHYADVNGNREYIENYLKTTGFKTYIIPEEKKEILYIAGRYNLKDIRTWIGSNEIRLVFTFKGDKIIKYEGYIYYHGL